jgi:O-antigen ligase
MNDLRDSPPTMGRGRAAVRLALAIVPVWLSASFVLTPTLPIELRAIVVAVAILSAVRPEEGLCVVAAAAPLGDLIAQGVQAGPVRFTEALVVAFLAGWLAGPTRGFRRGPATGALVRYAALALGALALASTAVTALQVKTYAPAGWPGLSWQALHQYFVPGADPFGAVASGQLVEGLGLSAAVVLLLRRRPMLAVWIPELLGAGCVTTVIAAYLLWHGFAFPAVLARHSLLGDRVVAHVSDINAAASYFALMLFVAAGMAARERGFRQIWWLAVVASAAAGLWFSGSRSADAAVALTAVAAAIWQVRYRWRIPVRYVAVSVCAIAIAGALLLRSMEIETDVTRHSAGLRIQFTQSSYRMIRARPWFGLGIGQYYATSPMFLNTQLAWAYGLENAHDYFLQLAVEIGLIGFTVTVALIAGMLWLLAQAIARAPDNSRLLGIACGVVAFLATCISGHPFLSPEVALPFWLVAGLGLVLSAPSTLLSRAGPRTPGAPAMACAIALALTIPIRAREAPPGPRYGPAVEGLFDWETGADGRRYRWTGEYASVFVEPKARLVEIPMRAPTTTTAEGPAFAEVSVDGSRGVKWPLGDHWSNVSVVLPYTPAIVQARRINIRASRIRSLPDARTVGVAVGEPIVLER